MFRYISLVNPALRLIVVLVGPVVVSIVFVGSGVGVSLRVLGLLDDLQGGLLVVLVADQLLQSQYGAEHQGHFAHQQRSAGHHSDTFVGHGEEAELDGQRPGQGAVAAALLLASALLHQLRKVDLEPAALQETPRLVLQ